MDGVGDTPQTVMTTRAPAVLKMVEKLWVTMQFGFGFFVNGL